MKPILFFLACICVVACSNSGKEWLSKCDSVEIRFTAGESKEVTKTISTTNKTAIRKLAGFLGTDSARVANCTYTGNLSFYRQGRWLLTASFNTRNGCRHFLVEEEEASRSVTMSDEAAAFLESLAEGKSWY